jgi:hypothetical protein
MPLSRECYNGFRITRVMTIGGSIKLILIIINVDNFMVLNMRQINFFLVRYASLVKSLLPEIALIRCVPTRDEN